VINMRAHRSREPAGPSFIPGSGGDFTAAVVLLPSTFGPTGSDQINLRQIAKFAKPGFRTAVAIYEVARR
jgi:hypothetical protein